MNIELESQIMRFSLIAGIVSEAEVTAWSDSLILTTDNPSINLINLATCNGFDEQHEFLNLLSGGHYEKEAFIHICKLLSENVDLHKSAKSLDRINFYIANLTTEHSNFCIWLSDESSLVLSGHKELNPALKELREFLVKV